MSQIRSKDTKPELLVRKFLFANGFRYKLHDKKLPGKPDIVLPRYKSVVFVHGCFWHGHHGCKYFVIPSTRTEWWQSKIQNNQLRDIKNEIDLVNNGWKVYTIWECDINRNKEKIFTELLEKIVGNV